MKFKDYFTQEVTIEESSAINVAKDLFKKNKGKNDDISPKEIESALGDKYSQRNYDTVVKYLKSKGFHIWKKVHLRKW